MGEFNDNVYYNLMKKKTGEEEQQPDFNVSVREWLIKQGITDIGWDDKTKTILVNGKPFMTSDAFKIINGKSFSNEDMLKKALQNFLATSQPTGTPTGSVLQGKLQPIPNAVPSEAKLEPIPNAVPGEAKPELLSQTGGTQPAEQPKEVAVRQWLISQGIPNSDIGWDNKTKTVTVKGQPFLVNPKNVNGTTFADEETLKSSLQKLVSQGIVPKSFENPLIDAAKVKLDEAGNVNVIDYLKQVGIEATQKEDGIYVGDKKITDNIFASEKDIISAYKAATGEDLPNNVYDLQDAINKGNVQAQYDVVNKYIDEIMKGIENPEENPITKYVTNYWDAQVKVANDRLQISYNNRLTALQNEEAKVKANYAGAEWEIQDAIMKARARTAGNMAARGVLLSSVMSNAIANVEVWGIQETYKLEAKKAADLNSIAADIATLTANYELEKDEIYNTMLTQKGLQMMQLLEKDQDRLRTLQDLQMNIEATLKGLEGTEGYQKALNKIKEQSDEIKAQQEEYDRMLNEWKIKDTSDRDWARIELSAANLDENARQFDERLKLDKQEFDWQKQKDQSYIDIARYNATKGTATQGESLDLDVLFKGNEADIVKTLKNLESYSETQTVSKDEYDALVKAGRVVKTVNVDVTQGTYTVDVIPESIANQITLGKTILSVYGYGKHLSQNNIMSFVDNLKNIFKVTDQSQAEEIINRLGDPMAKVLGVLYSASGGDIEEFMSDSDNAEKMKGVCENFGVSWEIFKQYYNYITIIPEYPGMEKWFITGD